MSKAKSKFDPREQYKIGVLEDGKFTEYKIQPLNLRASDRLNKIFDWYVNLGDTLYIQVPKGVNPCFLKPSFLFKP